MCAIYSLLMNHYSLTEIRAFKSCKSVWGSVDALADALCEVDAACLRVMTITATFCEIVLCQNLAVQSPQSLDTLTLG